MEKESIEKNEKQSDGRVIEIQKLAGTCYQIFDLQMSIVSTVHHEM